MNDLKFETAENVVDAINGICRDCGEYMEGDGYTLPFHCINLSEEVWWYNEPDSGPWYCGFAEEEE